jgi:MarR family transcriptional regulator for hemolysin
MTDTGQLGSLFMVMLPHLERGWRKEADAALSAYNLSVATAVPLLVIGRLGDGIRQVQLADALAIDEASLTPILHQLCAADLVERQPDPRDRRAKILHLTKAGLVAAQQAEAALARVRTRLLDGVSRDDLAAAVRVFQAIEGSIGRNAMPPARHVA